MISFRPLFMMMFVCVVKNIAAQTTTTEIRTHPTKTDIKTVLPISNISILPRLSQVILNEPDSIAIPWNTLSSVSVSESGKYLAISSQASGSTYVFNSDGTFKRLFTNTMAIADEFAKRYKFFEEGYSFVVPSTVIIKGDSTPSVPPSFQKKHFPSTFDASCFTGDTLNIHCFFRGIAMRPALDDKDKIFSGYDGILTYIPATEKSSWYAYDMAAKYDSIKTLPLRDESSSVFGAGVSTTRYGGGVISGGLNIPAIQSGLIDSIYSVVLFNAPESRYTPLIKLPQELAKRKLHMEAKILSATSPDKNVYVIHSYLPYLYTIGSKERVRLQGISENEAYLDALELVFSKNDKSIKLASYPCELIFSFAVGVNGITVVTRQSGMYDNAAAWLYSIYTFNKKGEQTKPRKQFYGKTPDGYSVYSIQTNGSELQTIEVSPIKDVARYSRYSLK